jgi:hypothetical protein
MDHQASLLPEKLFQYLLHLFDTGTTYDVHEFLTHSKIHTQKDSSSSFADAHGLIIVVDPEIYKKYQGMLREMKASISQKLSQFTHVPITRVEVHPDLSKFQILEGRIVPINTPWQDINSGQTHLLCLQRTATQTIDFQNIGNAARTLLQKVATAIFNPNIHVPEEPGIDVSEAKFKNRLHTYIKAELGAKENKEMREYAISLVTTAEKSVDLANKLTHDLKANVLMAESCIISTISVIGLIKSLQK